MSVESDCVLASPGDFIDPATVLGLGLSEQSLELRRTYHISFMGTALVSLNCLSLTAIRFPGIHLINHFVKDVALQLFEYLGR